MVQRLTIIALAPFLWANTVCSEEWTTQDGAVAVTVPDLSRFVAEAPAPPVSALWVAHDGTLTLGVVEVAMPRPMELLKASVEEGFAEEMNGEIIASSIDRQEGRDVFHMTARGQMFEKDVIATQTVLTIGSRMYKAMAIGFGKDTRIDPDAIGFIRSFTILIAKPTPSHVYDVRADNPVPNDDAESLINKISGRIGAASVILLILCLAVLRHRRAKSRRKPTATAN